VNCFGGVFEKLGEFLFTLFECVFGTAAIGDVHQHIDGADQFAGAVA